MGSPLAPRCRSCEKFGGEPLPAAAKWCYRFSALFLSLMPGNLDFIFRAWKDAAGAYCPPCRSRVSILSFIGGVVFGGLIYAAALLIHTR